MPPPDTLKKAHARAFPGRAFYPSSIRPTNRDVMDAAFLNWIYGREEKSDEPAILVEKIKQEILRGDKEPQRLAMQVIEQVLFGQSEGHSGRSGDTMRMSHAVLGRHYRPKTFDMEDWANSLFAHSPMPPSVFDALAEIVEQAEKRPKNIFEDAALTALGVDLSAQSKNPKVVIKTKPDEGTPPFALVHDQFGRLVARLTTSQRAEVSTSVDQAERVLADVRRLVEIFVWIYWVQLHANAWRALQAIRAGQSPVSNIEPMLFGYATEMRNVSQRPFAEEGRQLPALMYNGSLAINALVALHQATGWKDAKWFDKLGQLSSPKDVRAFNDWIGGYRKLAGLSPIEPTSNLAAGLGQAYDSIRDHYQPLADVDKYPHTVGYGVPRDLGQAGRCHLMKNLGRNRGTVPMVDLDLVLLFARATAGHDHRVRLVDVFGAMEEAGIRFDEISKQEVRTDLEIQGRVRALSDSGEAIYVEVR
jgi:hypothetical protein